jgi:molybdenum cofactor guanylyltransferase
MQNYPVSGIVLAGGKSSRFGACKSLYPYRDRPMIEWVMESLRSLCSEVVISTNQPEDYAIYPVRCIRDLYTGCGPLGGIHSSLKASAYDDNLIAGTDLPELQPDIFRVLLQHKEGYQVVVPVHQGKIETMACYFHKSAVPILENSLKKKQYRLTDVFASLRTLYLDVEKMPFYSHKLFANINRLSDIVI